MNVICVGHLSITIKRYLRWSHSKERRTVLVQCFRGFTPWSVGFIAVGLWWGSISWEKHMTEQNYFYSKVGSKEGGKETRVPVFLGGTPQWPPTRPHLLNVPLPPSSTTLGTRPLTHGHLGDIQHPNYSSILVWNRCENLQNLFNNILNPVCQVLYTI
jgi:hypothetical protein